MLLVSGATATLRPLIAERPDVFGVLTVPRDGNALPPSCRWAADNGAFSGFDEDAFLAMLKRHAGQRAGCIFVAAPDVVGAAVATLALFDKWEPRISSLGYPVALVAQDGLKHTWVPWARIAAIFIGIHYAAVTGCDSIDGSGWSKYPEGDAGAPPARSLRAAPARARHAGGGGPHVMSADRQPVYKPGCAPDCGCQSRRLATVQTVFSTGVRRELVELPAPKDYRAVLLPAAKLARSRWFVWEERS